MFESEFKSEVNRVLEIHCAWAHTLISIHQKLNKIVSRKIQKFEEFRKFDNCTGSSLNWTVLSQSKQSKRLKLEGQKNPKWSVWESPRSWNLKADGPQKKILDLKQWIWVVSRMKSRLPGPFTFTPLDRSLRALLILPARLDRGNLSVNFNSRDSRSARSRYRSV